MKEHITPQTLWQTIERPGYQGKKKEEHVARWNSTYGEGNWRMAWQLKNGEICTYQDIFYNFYVAGYARHFLDHPEEADFLTAHFSYTYDKDWITREEAFDPFALYDKPGRPNQFHNVALNIAIESFVGQPFSGSVPLQVREGKPGTDPSEWPAGWRWSPSRIMAVRQDLIPQNEIHGWWQPGSIEDVYQTAKVLQVRR